MKKIPLILLLAVISSLAATILSGRPADTSAGGLPCFICHGVQMQGSDLAPSVADTKLNDEQIMVQIRHPRGMMPALPEFGTQSIVDIIRSYPTGQPTAALSPADRSEALATLAAVAIARSTEYAQVTPAPTALGMQSTPAPSRVGADPVNKSAAGPSGEPAASNWFNMIGGLVVLGAGAGLAWITRRRGT